MTGDDVSRPMSMQKDTILNICCNNGCNMFFFKILTLNG